MTYRFRASAITVESILCIVILLGKFFTGMVSHCLPLKESDYSRSNICSESGLNPRELDLVGILLKHSADLTEWLITLFYYFCLLFVIVCIPMHCLGIILKYFNLNFFRSFFGFSAFLAISQFTIVLYIFKCCLLYRDQLLAGCPESDSNPGPLD